MSRSAYLQDNWFMKLSLIMQFRAARKASEEVGAQIVLGDRPIEITVCILSCKLRLFLFLQGGQMTGGIWPIQII